MKRNMAGWHRALYAIGGIAAFGWGWSQGSERILPFALGGILLVEALTGV